MMAGGTHFLALRPLVVAALHLPPLVPGEMPSLAWLEDYVLANAGLFARAGIPAIKLQDETREPGRVAAVTVAVMASLGRLIRTEFPGIALGIIVQAHDPVAPIAIAKASGAHFVRLKVFAGAAITAEGLREGLGTEAIAYRSSLGAQGIAVLADAHDRTCCPLGPVSDERAALWVESLGADAVILTGADFSGTLSRIAAARKAGLRRPVLIGGGVDEANVAAALESASGVIVSSSLKRDVSDPGDLVQWDAGKAARLMDRARAAVQQQEKSR
jgi:membrane complex biogenesis BtpA family protein